MLDASEERDEVNKAALLFMSNSPCPICVTRLSQASLETFYLNLFQIHILEIPCEAEDATDEPDSSGKIKQQV